MTEDEILDFYGQCTKEKCHCITIGWIGRRCPYWKSFGARTFDELKVAQEKFSAKISLHSSTG